MSAVNIGKLHPKSGQGWPWRSEQRPVDPSAWGRAASSSSQGVLSLPAPQGVSVMRKAQFASIAPGQLEKTLPAEGQGQARPQSLVQWPLSLDLAHFPVMTLLMLSWLINYIHTPSVASEQVDFRRKSANFPTFMCPNCFP